MFDFSQVNIFTCNNQLTQREKNIEENAILYLNNILTDTIERKCFKNSPLSIGSRTSYFSYATIEN